MRARDPSARAAHADFDVHLTENVPVPMRDGVRLATDVYRPARDGRPLSDRRPVLLHRTPYNKTETEATLGQCRWFAARGYVVVNQDCHPRFDVNPNTGEPIGRDRRRVVADNTVFHQRGRESRVVLPIIPIAPATGGGSHA